MAVGGTSLNNHPVTLRETLYYNSFGGRPVLSGDTWDETAAVVSILSLLVRNELS